jgi:hypothetical protein
VLFLKARAFFSNLETTNLKRALHETRSFETYFLLRQ